MTSSPANKIQEKIQSKTISRYAFPPDTPPVHFIINECEWNSKVKELYNQFQQNQARAVGNTTLQQSLLANFNFVVENAKNVFDELTSSQQLKVEKIYKLPLPTPLVDQFSVTYDDNFNYLTTITSIATQARDPAFAPALNTFSAATGITLNNFKSVTLSQPEFRRHQFSWKFSPREFKESEMIQTILYGLRKGMTPRTLGTGTGILSKALLVFPKIYLLAFIPNARYLYKFKPCVLETLSINYNGDQAVPAFYRAEEDFTNMPPESVVVNTTWIELEYWINKDYDTTELPSTNPYPNYNFYELPPNAQGNQ